MSLSVSVAMCTHNGKEFVAQQLRSILGQSTQPGQLIISDDASTDGTPGIVRSTIAEWRAANPEARLEVIEIDNSAALGVTANFAGAIAATTRDLVALSDQDDVWPVDKLRRMVAEFESRPELLLLHTDATLVDACGRDIGQTLFASLNITASTKRAVHSGQAFETLMKRNIVTGATTLFRRELADAAAPFPHSWLHDEWLAIVASATGQIDLIEETLLDYRQHSGNEIGARRLSFVGKIGRMLEPGADRNRRLLARAEQLSETITEFPLSSERAVAVRQKLIHEKVRSSLGRSRTSRVVPVACELTSGRYHKFGYGFADAIRDLLQPL